MMTHDHASTLLSSACVCFKTFCDGNIVCELLGSVLVSMPFFLNMAFCGTVHFEAWMFCLRKEAGILSCVGFTLFVYPGEGAGWERADNELIDTFYRSPVSIILASLSLFCCSG